MQIKSNRSESFFFSWLITWHEDHYGVEKNLVPGNDPSSTTCNWGQMKVNLTPDEIGQLALGAIKEGHPPSDKILEDLRHAIRVHEIERDEAREGVAP